MAADGSTFTAEDLLSGNVFEIARCAPGKAVFAGGARLDENYPYPFRIGNNDRWVDSPPSSIPGWDQGWVAQVNVMGPSAEIPAGTYAFTVRAYCEP